MSGIHWKKHVRFTGLGAGVYGRVCHTCVLICHCASVLCLLCVNIWCACHACCVCYEHVCLPLRKCHTRACLYIHVFVYKSMCVYVWCCVMCLSICVCVCHANHMHQCVRVKKWSYLKRNAFTSSTTSAFPFIQILYVIMNM